MSIIIHRSAENLFAKELERLLAHQNHHFLLLDLDLKNGGNAWLKKNLPQKPKTN
jgi:hypothetical protein